MQSIMGKPPVGYACFLTISLDDREKDGMGVSIDVCTHEAKKDKIKIPSYIGGF